MLPTLEIGPWRLSSYTLLYTVAALAACTLAFFLLRRLAVAPVVLLRGILATTVSGFAGNYLVRVVPTIQRYFQAGTWEWVGGGSYIGGLLVGVAVFSLYCRWNRIPLLPAYDRVAPALALGQAIGRLGCLAAGCCYGRPTASWLALYLPNNQGDWAFRYPTQLLSAGANLATMAALLLVEKSFAARGRTGEVAGHDKADGASMQAAGTSHPLRRELPAGFLFMLYIGLYCLERLLVEFLRADGIPAIGPVSWAQLYTVIGMILAGGLMAWQLRARGPGGTNLAPCRTAPPAPGQASQHKEGLSPEKPAAANERLRPGRGPCPKGARR